MTAQSASSLAYSVWPSLSVGCSRALTERAERAVEGSAHRSEAAYLEGAQRQKASRTGLSGFLSLVFGGVVAMQSGTNVAPFMWTLGGYALLSGALLVALALNIRTWPRTT
jgi:hypothetical protein